MTFVVSSKRFAIAKVAKLPNEFFAIVNDGRELTAVVEESVAEELDAIEIEKGFRVFTYDAKLDFDLVGFIAKIASAMAEKSIPIFVISAYSTDHILVRERDADKAIEALTELGFKVRFR